jgi:hypothetical protein
LVGAAGKPEVNRKGLMKRIVLLAVAIALMLPGAALAENPTCDAYHPQLCETVSASTTSADTEGTLPFTGLDVALLVVGGGTLLGAGLVVRRLSRRPN